MDAIETITLHVGHTVAVQVTPLISEAISRARMARAAGQTKIAAVRGICPSIRGCSKQQIWYAIIHGVNISSRGAVTYYYNVQRPTRANPSYSSSHEQGSRD